MKLRIVAINVLCAIPLVFAVLFNPQPIYAESEPILGNWARGDGIAKVNIYRCGHETFCAKNFWIKPGAKGEKVNDYITMRVIERSPNRYRGTAYDPQRRLRMSFTLNIAPNNLQIRGCVLGGLACRTADWHRIEF